MSKQPPPAPTASAIGPCPTIIQIVGRPGTGSFTQDHRTTRPPPTTCLGPVWERAFHLVYLHVFHERLSVCVLASFPYVFEDGIRLYLFLSSPFFLF